MIFKNNPKFLIHDPSPNDHMYKTPPCKSL